MSFSFSSFGNEDVNTFSQTSKPLKKFHDFYNNAANAGDVTNNVSSSIRSRGVSNVGVIGHQDNGLQTHGESKLV